MTVRKHRIIILLVLVSLGLAGCLAVPLALLVFGVRAQFVRVRSEPQQTIAWREFTPESGQFAVAFPQIPVVEAQHVPEGPELVHTATVEQDDRLFKVTWQATSPSRLEIRPMLEHALQQLLSRVGAEGSTVRVVDSANGSLECAGRGRVNGRRVQFKCRVLFSNGTVYQLLWLGATLTPPQNEADQFLNSFRLRA